MTKAKRLPIRTAALVYQAGIANLFEVSRQRVLPVHRTEHRIAQGDFHTLEAIAYDLMRAGADVQSYACNMAGDVARQVWSSDLSSAPFSSQFHPVRS